MPRTCPQTLSLYDKRYNKEAMAALLRTILEYCRTAPSPLVKIEDNAFLLNKELKVEVLSDGTRVAWTQRAVGPRHIFNSGKHDEYHFFGTVDERSGAEPAPRTGLKVRQTSDYPLEVDLTRIVDLLKNPRKRKKVGMLATSKQAAQELEELEELEELKELVVGVAGLVRMRLAGAPGADHQLHQFGEAKWIDGSRYVGKFERVGESGFGFLGGDYYDSRQKKKYYKFTPRRGLERQTKPDTDIKAWAKRAKKVLKKVLAADGAADSDAAAVAESDGQAVAPSNSDAAGAAAASAGAAAARDDRDAAGAAAASPGAAASRDDAAAASANDAGQRISDSGTDSGSEADDSSARKPPKMCPSETFKAHDAKGACSERFSRLLSEVTRSPDARKQDEEKLEAALAALRPCAKNVPVLNAAVTFLAQGRSAAVAPQQGGMTVLSICGGVGPELIALVRRGTLVRRMILYEIDPVAVAVVQAFCAKHDIEFDPRGDMNSITDLEVVRGWGRVDLVFVSTPCPSFSRANPKRGGFNDNKGFLTIEAAQVCEWVKELWPDAFIVEEMVVAEETMVLKLDRLFPFPRLRVDPQQLSAVTGLRDFHTEIPPPPLYTDNGKIDEKWLRSPLTAQEAVDQIHGKGKWFVALPLKLSRPMNGKDTWTFGCKELLDGAAVNDKRDYIAADELACAMGFPRDHFVAVETANVNGDSHRDNLIRGLLGNAIVVPVLEYLLAPLATIWPAPGGEQALL